MEVLPGPQKLLRWGVPDGTRDELTGKLIHDDLLISAALCAVLDEQEWYIQTKPVVLGGLDPLDLYDQGGF